MAPWKLECSSRVSANNSGSDPLGPTVGAGWPEFSMATIVAALLAKSVVTGSGSAQIVLSCGQA